MSDLSGVGIRNNKNRSRVEAVVLESALWSESAVDAKSAVPLSARVLVAVA